MKRFWCRWCQTVLRGASYLLKWRKPALICGEDAARRLPARLAQDGVAKALIVTGPTIRRKRLIDGLLAEMERLGVAYAIFDRTMADPTFASVEDAAKTYRDEQCDAIIAFGGGSPMDCAKACAARVVYPKRKLARLCGVMTIHRRLPPLYAVPTTSGTGSEATFAAVLTDDAHHKRAMADMKLIPQVAVLDPILTLGLPPKVTANSGMDALSHAVEAYIGRSNTKQTKECAVYAVKAIFEHLPEAYADGMNRKAREWMQSASFMAGQAFTRAYVGYVHALAHAIGGKYGLPHGYAIAVTMPHVLRAYGDAAAKPLAELARHIGAAREGMGEPEQASAMIAAIERLNASLGIPSTLAELLPQDITELAALAAKEGNVLYPAPKVLLAEELEPILLAMLPKTQNQEENSDQTLAL